MYRKKITYTDFNGNKRTEEFLFNLTKAELSEMEMSVDGGYLAMLQDLVDKQNIPKIVQNIKRLILSSYGEKSLDGKYFHKSEALSEAFSHTEAYSELFMELCGDAEKASEFFNGVIPQPEPEQSTHPALN